MEQEIFNGFTPEALQFLKDVKRNNSKSWFDEHKSDYERLLLNPFKALVTDLNATLIKIDPHFETRPAINKTISRLNRDIRFSKDKSLYRDTMWLTFKRNNKEWRDAPGFFFEISPVGYRYGMGYYSATRMSMDTFRTTINKNIEVFQRIVNDFGKQDVFVLEGDMYKRIIDPTKTDEINQWYNRKNLYLVHNSERIDELYHTELVNQLICGFNLLKDIYNYLCQVEDNKK